MSAPASPRWPATPRSSTGPAARRRPRRSSRRSPATCARGTANDGGAFATSLDTIELIAAARRAAARADRQRAGGDRVRREHDDAELPARARGRADARAGRRDRRHRPRPRRQRRRRGCASPRTTGSSCARAAGARRRDARRRRARGAARRPHARRRVHARVERGRVRSPTRGASPRAAHDAGALAWADARALRAAPPARPRARSALDVLLCSPYKFFGPHLGHRRDPPRPRRDAGPPTACARRARTRPATASRPARRRSRRSPAPSRRSSTSRRSATATSTPRTRASARTRRRSRGSCSTGCRRSTA